MRKNEVDDLSWLKRIENSNGLIIDGATMLREWRAENSDYKTSLDVPSVMDVSEANKLAPNVCEAIDRLRSGIALLDFVENSLRKIMGEKRFAESWPKAFADYTDLRPFPLERLAYDVLCVTTDFARDAAAIAIMVYALLGLAGRVKPIPRYNCRLCYRKAVSRGRYCDRHQLSREDRTTYTKKRRKQSTNRDVERRRALRVKELAIGLRLNEHGPYHRMFWQLRTFAERSSDVPAALEDVQDNGFVAGDRMGPNGAAWLIHAWKVLPHMKKALGWDWPELVRMALKRKYWSPVLQRLATIDPHQHVTDADTWVCTLIAADAWAEAAEIERRLPHRGRPRLNESDLQVLYAQKQLRDGRSIADVALSIGVSTKTLYRWKKTMPSITIH